MDEHRGFRFVANLKPYTVHRGPGVPRFGAYLLSTDYARSFQDLAREVVGHGSALCADNGNFDLIRTLIARHTPAADALDAERRVHERRVGRRARRDDLPASLRDRYRQLASEVRTGSDSATDRSRVAEIVRAQTAMSPTYLVGMEDFTVPALTGLGVSPEVLDVGEPFYARLAKRSIEFAIKTRAGRYGPCTAAVFAGLHALDYDTARIAGLAAGKAGVTAIATGLVGALQDKTYTDSRVEAGRVIELGHSIPRPYLRVAEIAAGLHEGCVTASGHRPCFHGLGAGTPILLPLLAALGDSTTYTATDSTAPIVDGWSGPTISLYVDEPAPLKYKAHRIAEVWLADDRPWECRCPHCRAFNRACPPRVDEARRWWRAQNKPPLTSTSVRAPSPLADWLPLLGSPSDPGLRLTGAMARVNHNHWVLQRIEAAARRHSDTYEGRVAWTDEIVRAYLASAADPQWKLAVSAAWMIVRRAAERTRDAAPTPLTMPTA
ncbi:MAG: hypothetical protein H0T46_05370 [Deltaproteobacteria bacterium]|nr:hypothetical protein [Deltaproteobacteria bacterium]